MNDSPEDEILPRAVSENDIANRVGEGHWFLFHSSSWSYADHFFS